MSNARCWLTVALGAISMACGQDPQWDLNRADEQGWDRLRERQHLRYIEDNVEVVRDISPGPGADDFLIDVENYCGMFVLLDPDAGDIGLCDPNTAIGDVFCAVQESLCAANLLEQVAGIAGEPLTLGTGIIPAQSTATNALLHELAIRAAREALLVSVNCLRGGASLSTDQPDCTPTTIDDTWTQIDGGVAQATLTYARSFATALVVQTAQPHPGCCPTARVIGEEWVH